MATRKTAKVETSETSEQVIQSMIEQVAMSDASPEHKQVAIEALQSTGKVEVVETAEVKPEVVETAEVEQESLLPDEMSGVEIICNDCDDLDVDELKQVIEYCSSRIEELQKEEVEALEAEMRAIQDKLMAMRGFRLKPVSTTNGNSGQKRTDKPLINPKNPAQVYTFGKTPEWLSKWMIETGKSVRELRDIQEQQSKVANS